MGGYCRTLLLTSFSLPLPPPLSPSLPRATDPDGSADPVVVVEVDFGDGKKQKAATRVVSNDRNAVFDETFKFEFKGLTHSEIEMGQISVCVIDADVTVAGEKEEEGGGEEWSEHLILFTNATLFAPRFAHRPPATLPAGHGVGDLIGVWNADIFESIFALPHHELYRQYVCLENDEATNADESGTQGFLKLSVSATGPGQKRRQHNIEKERALERKAAEAAGDSPGTPMMAPMQAVELRFLVVKIHNIENLVVPASNCFVKVRRTKK